MHCHWKPHQGVSPEVAGLPPTSRQLQPTIPVNVAVEGKIHLNDFGAGTLIPLQKPGKPRGPLSNLRPVVLLNGIQKLLSLILLKRFSPYANSYIPATQPGFMKGRSCADIIFAKRLVCSMALLTDMGFHFLCLDLSRAFDTPSRESGED